MDNASWLFILCIFVNLYTQVHPQGELQSYFNYEDFDLSKPNKFKFFHSSRENQYNPSRPAQETAIVPPNGLPIYPMPKYLQKKFYSLENQIKLNGPEYAAKHNFMKQGGPESNDEIPVFPEPDGSRYGPQDEHDFEEMPARLTEAKKWGEFKEMMNDPEKKYKQKLRENYEENMHMWAGYSRNLLARAKQEKIEENIRKHPEPINPKAAYRPSVGLSPYWEPLKEDDKQSAEESGPMVPWGNGEGPGAAIANMKAPEPDEEEPFPWLKEGKGSIPGGSGMGGGLPPGMAQGGGQGGFGMDGGLPPGMAQGGGQGGFGMGGGLPPGMAQGGGQGGFGMDGGPPPGMAHGRGQGGFGMDGGLPPGMAHGRGQSDFGMGSGLPPGMTQGGGQGGSGMGGGLPPGMAQGRGQGGSSMGGGPPPGMAHGWGQGGFGMDGGLPPGMAQGGGQGGSGMGGGLPPGMAQGRGQGGSSMGDGLPPGMAQGGGQGGFGMNGGLPPGMAHGRGQSDFGMGGGLPPGMTQGGGQGGFGMGGGLPPGMSQGGGQDGFGMGGGLPPGMAHGRGQSDFGMGGDLPPGMTQGGGQGGFGMGGGLPPGMSQGGGQGTFGINGGLPPGMAQGGRQGGSGMGGGLPPGMTPGTGPGMGPGMGEGMGEGMGPGMSREMGQDRGPGMGEDMDEDMAPGMGPGIQTGMGRGMGPSMGADLGQGMGPSMGPGIGQGMGDGMGKGMGPGMGHGMGAGIGLGKTPDITMSHDPALGREMGHGPETQVENGLPVLGGPPGSSGPPRSGETPGVVGPTGTTAPPGTVEPPREGKPPGVVGATVTNEPPGTVGPPGAGESAGASTTPRDVRPEGVSTPPGEVDPSGTGKPSGAVGSPGVGGPPGAVRPQDQHRRFYNTSKNYLMDDVFERATRSPNRRPPELDTRYVIPGTSQEDDTPEAQVPMDFIQSLSQNHHSFGSFVFTNDQMASVQVSNTKSKNKIPGPGSEADFPDGYRPNFGNPEKPNNGFPGGNSGMGQQHTGVGRSNALRFASPLRQGPDLPNDYADPKVPRDYQDSNPNALRMAQGPIGSELGWAGENMSGGPREPWPGYSQGQLPPGMHGPPPPPPGHEMRGHSFMGRSSPAEFMQGGQSPGMGGGPPPGFMQGGQQPGMRGGPPPEFMQGGQSPGMGGSPSAGFMQGGQFPGMGGGPPSGFMQGGQSPGMGGGPSPGFMQGRQSPGMGDGSPPGFMQGRQSPGMGGGPPPGFMQGRQSPGMGDGSPPGFMQGRQSPGTGGGPPPGMEAYYGDRRSLDNSTIEGGDHSNPSPRISGKSTRRVFEDFASLEARVDGMRSGLDPEVVEDDRLLDQIIEQSEAGAGSYPNAKPHTLVLTTTPRSRKDQGLPSMNDHKDPKENPREVSHDSISISLRKGQEVPGFDENGFETGWTVGDPTEGLRQEWPGFTPGQLLSELKGPPTPSPGHKRRGHPVMERGPPPGFMQGGQSPGLGRGPTSGFIHGGQSSGMGGGPPPVFLQGGQSSGMGGGPPVGMEAYYRRSLDNSTIEEGDLKPSAMVPGKSTRRHEDLAFHGDPVGEPNYQEMVQNGRLMEKLMENSEYGAEGGSPRGGGPNAMGGGPTPGFMQAGQHPGLREGPPPGFMQGGRNSGVGGGPPPGMGEGPSPYYMQGVQRPIAREGPPEGFMQGGQYPGIEEGRSSGFIQGGPPPGMNRGIPSKFQEKPKASTAISEFPSGPPQGQPADSPDYDRLSRLENPEGSEASSAGFALMQIAQRKINFQERLQEIKREPKGPTTEHIPTVNEMLRALPHYDDFGAPVNWVTLNSPDTKDGLAQVTDQKTHKNGQFVIEGELFVPIVDESMARLGWTTEANTEGLIEVTTRSNVNEYTLKVVMRSLNLNHTTQRDWLVYETVVGSNMVAAPECAADGCQSRCRKAGCDATCKGDTCHSGCVGVSCNAFGHGPGSNAMCIGEHCTAKCVGLNCEAKCWGKDCSATCSLLACLYTVNGRTSKSTATWDEMYPQYGQGNPNTHQQDYQHDPDQATIGRQGDYNYPDPGY